MTYSKSELKKMFLRVLYECKYGKLQDHSWGVDSIVPAWINQYFNISLTNDERQPAFNPWRSFEQPDS